LAAINGEVDWHANFIPDIEEVYISEDPENHHYWFPPTGAAVHLYLNTEIAPFDNADVRKAVSMAIDRQQICDIAMFGYTHPADATGLSDAFDSWKSEEAKAATWTTFNVDEPTRLLDAAGLTMDGDVRKTADGTALEFDLNVVSGWSDWVQSCEIMSRSLAEVGIKATVQPYDQTTWQSRVQEGDFTMSIGWSSQGATVITSTAAS
jgi:peptide/nickel transport system substrate-binding protein